MRQHIAGKQRWTFGLHGMRFYKLPASKNKDYWFHYMQQQITAHQTRAHILQGMVEFRLEK